MHELDWGAVTPESSNLAKNMFTYVFNHKLSSPAEVDRTIRFIVGRLLFYDKHLPGNPIHIVKVDARGQNIDDATAALIIQRLQKLYNEPCLQEVNVTRK